MSTLRQLARSLRPTILVVLGALIGAGVAPVMAGVHPSLQTASVQTRAASCQGLSFHPVDAEMGFNYLNVMIYRNDNNGSGFFVCNAALPNGAVVSKVSFTVSDGAANAEVRYCGLFRSGLAAASASTTDELAQVPTTGSLANPGVVRLTDDSIQNATVDNTRYGYWFQCQLTAANTNLGIFGADVVYKISAANG